MKNPLPLRVFLEWLLCLSTLVACTGAGSPSSPVGPSPGELGQAVVPGPSVLGNAADKYEGGFPAPVADTENCPYSYCLLDAKTSPQCRNEDGTFRVRFSGRVNPGLEDRWKNLNGRTLRIVDAAKNRFLDAPMSGEVEVNEHNYQRNHSGNFAVTLNTTLPLKREFFILPAGERPRGSGEESACEEGLCPSPQSEPVTWIGTSPTAIAAAATASASQPQVKSPVHIEKTDLQSAPVRDIADKLPDLPGCTLEKE